MSLPSSPQQSSLAFERRLLTGSPQAQDRVRRRLLLQNPTLSSPNSPAQLIASASGGAAAASGENSPSPRVDVGRMRCSPLVSPSKGDRFYSDRYIPSRPNNQWTSDFNMIQVLF